MHPAFFDTAGVGTTKAAIVKALGESVAYCDAVYASLTAASAAEMVKAGNNQVLRVQPLFGNVSHNVEHYGNLVTYFRMKNLVRLRGCALWSDAFEPGM